MGAGRSRHQAAATRKRIVKEMIQRRQESRAHRDYKDLILERLAELEQDQDEASFRSMRGSKGVQSREDED